jgi:hypothetical protein
MEIKLKRNPEFGLRSVDYISLPSWGKNLDATIFQLKRLNIGSKHFNRINNMKSNFLHQLFKGKTTLKNQSFDNGINLFI